MVFYHVQAEQPISVSLLEDDCYSALGIIQFAPLPQFHFAGLEEAASGLVRVKVLHGAGQSCGKRNF